MTPPDDGTREEVLAKIAALARRLDPGPGTQVHEELADLREAVDSLRQQLAGQHHCCCHHSYWHYYPLGTTTVTYPQTWTTGTITYNTGGAIT
jgi:hypothetical protein